MKVRLYINECARGARVSPPVEMVEIVEHSSWCWRALAHEYLYIH